MNIARDQENKKDIRLQMKGNEKIEIYLKVGIAIYNSGEYHAAHGAWERYWLKLEKGSRDKLFLQGLIQFTAIIYHGINENWKGMRGLVESSLVYLNEMPEVYRGVDIESIRECLIEMKKDVEAFSQENIPSINYEGGKMELEDLEIESAFIAAEFCSGIKIVSTPAHSAVRAIDPKLRTSVTLSSIKISGFFPSSYSFGIISSIL